MAVTNIQAWADDLELVRLPQITTAIGSLETELSAVTQTFLDDLSAHSIRITGAQNTADFAQDNAYLALTQIYDTGLTAELYTNQQIQQLRDELGAQLGGSVSAEMYAAIQAAVNALLGTSVSDAQDAATRAELARLLADAKTNELIAETGEIVDDLNELMDNMLPQQNQMVLEALAEAQAARDRIDLLTNGLTEENLAIHFDGLLADSIEQAENIFTQADRFRSLRDSVASLWAYARDGDYTAYSQVETLRREMSSTIEGYAASFDERITVATGDDGGIVERVTTLEVESDDLFSRNALIETAMIEGDTALASQIGLLSVGTALQFDPFRIWYFDTTTEGWTGEPSGPDIVEMGYLRPDDGAGSRVISPSGLAIPGVTYRQVRARLRKSGTPTWLGQLWWRADGEAWDITRSVDVDEPTWAGDEGFITFNANWVDTIDQIRFDLVDTPDASNYVEIDVAMIGRPAPGATSADILTERTARIAANEAQATIIDGLSTSLTTLDGTVTANTGAVTALDGRVTSTEAGITAAADAVTTLTAEVADKATVELVDALRAEVVQGTNGDLFSVGEATRAIRSTLKLQGQELIDAAARSHLDQTAVRGAVAVATSTLSSEIRLTEEGIALNARAITLVETKLPGLASATAVQLLTSDLVVERDRITANATSITSLTATVANKASSDALSLLSAEVDVQGDTIVANASAITALTSTVGTKASASALTSLTTRVTNAEGTITSEATKLTSLTSRVGTAEGKITTVETTKVDAAGVISTMNTQISAIDPQFSNLGALVTSTAFAKSTATGLISGYVFRTRAGGAAGSVELVAANNVVSGATSLFRVSADRLRFEGDLTEFFSDVAITGNLIVNGAVSEQRYRTQSSSTDVTSTGYNAHVLISSSSVSFAADPNGDNPVLCTIFGQGMSVVGAQSGAVGFKLQGPIGGSWVDIAEEVYHYFDNTMKFFSYTVATLPEIDVGTIASIRVVGRLARGTNSHYHSAALSAFSIQVNK